MGIVTSQFMDLYEAISIMKDERDLEEVHEKSSSKILHSFLGPASERQTFCVV